MLRLVKMEVSWLCRSSSNNKLIHFWTHTSRSEGKSLQMKKSSLENEGENDWLDAILTSMFLVHFFYVALDLLISFCRCVCTSLPYTLFSIVLLSQHYDQQWFIVGKQFPNIFHYVCVSHDIANITAITCLFVPALIGDHTGQQRLGPGSYGAV